MILLTVFSHWNRVFLHYIGVLLQPLQFGPTVVVSLPQHLNHRNSSFCQLGCLREYFSPTQDFGRFFFKILLRCFISSNDIICLFFHHKQRLPITIQRWTNWFCLFLVSKLLLNKFETFWVPTLEIFTNNKYIYYIQQIGWWILANEKWSLVQNRDTTIQRMTIRRMLIERHFWLHCWLSDFIK